MESVDILIEHGTLLTLNAQRHIVTDGAVAIRKDRIVAVGKTADLKTKYRGEKTIDASLRLVMPGPGRRPRPSRRDRAWAHSRHAANERLAEVLVLSLYGGDHR